MSRVFCAARADRLAGHAVFFFGLADHDRELEGCRRGLPLLPARKCQAGSVYTTSSSGMRLATGTGCLVGRLVLEGVHGPSEFSSSVAARGRKEGGKLMGLLGCGIMGWIGGPLCAQPAAGRGSAWAVREHSPATDIP